MSDFSDANRPDDTTAPVRQRAQEKLGEGGGLVSEKATEVVGTARERAGDVTDEAQAQARDVAGELRTQLQDQARTQTERLAENVRRLADDLGAMGDNGKEGSAATNAVKRIAGRGRDAASRLEDRGPEGLVSDLQDFARRRPGAFLAGAALAGFATARLGKGVKGASDGASSAPDGDPADRSAPESDDGGRVDASTYGRQPTSPYGGPVSLSDPHPNTTPQQP